MTNKELLKKLASRIVEDLNGENEEYAMTGEDHDLGMADGLKVALYEVKHLDDELAEDGDDK
ncbi:hypothetical protein [Paucilactobacillus kaifaensis]|uniref:hypothetical protein n=1 Tax=Paucilactobacillus kaifaensis TaxID=2559921 RepID=UPI0010F7A811|nr:hypothetical protein [Paucilactobacillus kaifaensis]